MMNNKKIITQHEIDEYLFDLLNGRIKLGTPEEEALKSATRIIEAVKKEREEREARQ